jgi:hypothetical protein
MTTIHDARTTLYHLSDIIIAHGDNIPTAKADAATTIRAKLEREREREICRSCYHGTSEMRQPSTVATKYVSKNERSSKNGKLTQVQDAS